MLTPTSANEKSALVSVVQNLSDAFNLGMILYPETGGGNDNIDGAYIRYHVRQMIGDNQVAVSAGAAGQGQIRLHFPLFPAPIRAHGDDPAVMGCAIDNAPVGGGP